MDTTTPAPARHGPPPSVQQGLRPLTPRSVGRTANPYPSAVHARLAAYPTPAPVAPREVETTGMRNLRYAVILAIGIAAIPVVGLGLVSVLWLLS